MNTLKFDTKEQLQKKVDEYFAHCDKTMIPVRAGGEVPTPYTVSGLACWLKVERQTIYNYGKRDEFAEVIRDAHRRIVQRQEEQVLAGNYHAGFAQFSLKNNAAWTDKTEVETTERHTVNIIRPHKKD